MRNDSPRINSPLNVNLRSQPNPNAGILQSVSPETTIMILEDTPEKPFNAFWYPGYEYVELPDGTRGWLSKAVIYVPENRLQVRWRLQGDTEINVFQDNFRDGLLARLTSGSEIEILGYQASSYETGDFDMAQVRLPDGQIGWVERQNIAGG
jgi:SH3-like domain-containing protein